MDGEKEELYWGRLAASYDRDGEYIIGDAILQAIEERLLKEQRLGHAVEFGCGTGYFTKVIAGNATHVIATDLSETMLQVARTQLGGLGNVTIKQADCRNSSFPAESFDTVILANVVHVIDQPAQCLREANRILRHRGSLIIVDFTGYGMSLARKIKVAFRYLSKWGRPPRGGQHDLSPEQLVRLVEDSGFRVKDVELLQVGANALYLHGEKD
ncbi:MAG: class I SAM-dependent methyltransferase [Anaerolineales bacterium]|nr:class I SAM-dependent methyltransferase [Anaerolineales bacterium]